MSDAEIKRNESAAHAPEGVMRLAEKITKAQGCQATLTREASGYHLYIPCPHCIETHQRRELDDPKYAINLSILAELGDNNRASSLPAYLPSRMIQDMENESKKLYGSSICMRTRSSPHPHRFSIPELLEMATITERHPDIHTKAGISSGVGSAEREEHWEIDPVSGQSCPPPAGEVIPLAELPPGHPAIAYLVNRGYVIEDLASQFRCGFCTSHYPEGENGIYYRRMPGGWKDTPQHRIIFCSMINGVPLTWQARVIEKLSDDGLTKYMLHPYAGGGPFPSTDEAKITRSVMSEGYVGEIDITIHEGRSWSYLWSKTHTRANKKSPWIPVPPFDELRDGVLRFQPSKYRTAKYSSRQMMGWDAALARAAADPDIFKWVVLCEGPLDAARVGPGGVALIGSSISPDNAAKIASTFHIVFSAFDSDKAGVGATKKITQQLMSARQRAPVLQGVMHMPIPEGKDLGDMTPDQFGMMLRRVIRNYKRNI